MSSLSSRLASVQLVATDLDGTLLDPRGRITPRAAKAVRAAREAGIHVVPVTGRPPHVTWELAEMAGLGPLGVCSNGAVLVDLESAEVLDVTSVGADVAHRLVSMLRGLLPEAVFALDDLRGFTYEHAFFDDVIEWEGQMSSVADIREAINATCVKIIARRPGWTAKQTLEFLRNEIAEEAHVTSSGFDWVDIGAPGVSKAYAITTVCERLGIPTSAVLAVGDNHNDLPILSWAAHAAAPANAIPEVLAAVDTVIGSNAEDGVAALLEALVAERTKV